MKHLLNGVAIAAVFAIAAPVWAQNPSGGNAMGTPGPNPGGPGLTPYSTGGAPPPATSAAPPMHRHAKAMHHKMAHRGPALSGDTTAQLNREELARIQAGNMSNPPAPAAPPPPPSGRLPGPKTSGGRNIPQQ
ncbi:MAG TPA: hypothetical protein VGF34_11055 [Stellaceae bacterium]|jgi:hypothetical protein